MTDIIASVSGVRGIIGDNLTPFNIIKFTSAFAEYNRKKGSKNRIAVGRDGRLFGEIVSALVINNLLLSGFEVIDIGTAPTPTVQIATEELKCNGGISITASHNPQIWNGLKFLSGNGTFLDEAQVKTLLKIAGENKFLYAGIDKIKTVKRDYSWNDRHIKKVLALKIVDVNKIRKRKFKIVVDAVNSSGSSIVPSLLEKLGCKVIRLFCDGTGKFPHTPEPVPENLKLLSESVLRNKADMGISVDPDADRLVIITDLGKPFSEENTIVTAVKHVLKKSGRNKCATVNLSTTRGTDDIASLYKAKVYRSSVGEINVVKEMMRNKSVIGGEGSGGVIYPELHYGRDSLAGIALVLNEFADFGGKVSDFKKTLPEYFITKSKIENVKDPDKVIKRIEKNYRKNTDVVSIRITDGLKIDFKEYWIHLRKSNTEPIIRIITEAKSLKKAWRIQNDFLEMIRKELC